MAMHNTKLNSFVRFYNLYAKECNIRQTDNKGISRRLINAQCGFKRGDKFVSERQMMALFIASYKGSRENRDKQTALFSYIAGVLSSHVSYFGLAAMIEKIEDKEMNVMAREAKKLITAMTTKAMVNRAITEYEYIRRNSSKPTTDKKRIALAKEAIRGLKDKSMLMDLFNTKYMGSKKKKKVA